MNNNLKKIIFAILFIIIIIYSIFKLSSFINGPEIEIITPKNKSFIENETFRVSGKIKRAKELYIENRKVFFDKDGNFKEDFVFIYPYTILNIVAYDSWGRSELEKLIIYKK